MPYRTIIKLKNPHSTCSWGTPETVGCQKPREGIRYRSLCTSPVLVFFFKYPHRLSSEGRYWTRETFHLIH